MAIVKTTAAGASPDEDFNVGRPVDRTKSVVNQGGAPAARQTRTPGMINRPLPQSSADAGPKDFVRDTMAELERVTWPTREERASGTLVTILLLVFFAIYITGLDWVIRQAFEVANILPK